MNKTRRGFATDVCRWSTWKLIASCLATSLLAGCYIPTEGIRSPNPGPTASPYWPYEPGVMPPGRNGNPAQSPVVSTTLPSPIPGSQTQPAPTQGTPVPYPVAYGGNPPNPTAPPPSQGITPQYATWLVDGPEGRGFAYYLSEGYRRYAKLEDNAHDFEDAAKFLFRAGEVDRGEKVLPELLTMRTLPAYAVDDLLYARQRLMATFNQGATSIYPKLAANAQVAFDCWMEQQEENIQPQDIAQCRRSFEESIVRLETALIGRVQAAPAAPIAPCPPAAPAKPACDSTPLFVLFDFGKHELTPAGRETLQQAIDLANRSDNVPLVISAHTDRAGSDAYNDALSRRRLDTVISALEALGMPKDRLARANYFGETKPRVETPDGVASQDNRRVEIRLACRNAVAVSQCGRGQMETSCAKEMGGPTPCARQN